MNQTFLKPVYQSLRCATYVSAILSIAMILIQAKGELDQSYRFELSAKRIPVEAPKSIPEINQESIDIAMEVFNIEIPKNSRHPFFDTNLFDRGITISTPKDDKLTVKIGPSAFSSWGLLGSTLAHELEVHCNQNFFLIVLFDKLGLGGTENAEREAYDHELRYARHFHLNQFEVTSIVQTRDYFYPEYHLYSEDPDHSTVQNVDEDSETDIMFSAIRNRLARVLFAAPKIRNNQTSR